MPVWLQAGGWGLVGGLALVLGAAVAWFVDVPRRVVAGIMAFGAGVLVSALAFELVDEAERTGGLGPTVAGFLGGAVVYVAANLVLVGCVMALADRPVPAPAAAAAVSPDHPAARRTLGPVVR